MNSKQALRQANREAGLCACGRPPRPNRKTCQRCGDQVKAANDKRRNKEKKMADTQEIIRNKLRANITQLADALERLMLIDVDTVPAGGLQEANRMADSALHALRLLTNAVTVKAEVAPPAPPPPPAPVPEPPDGLVDRLDTVFTDLLGLIDGAALTSEQAAALRELIAHTEKVKGLFAAQAEAAA